MAFAGHARMQDWQCRHPDKQMAWISLAEPLLLHRTTTRASIGTRVKSFLGQLLTQIPQPMQTAESTTGKWCTMVMAPNGQAAAHSPNPTHPYTQSVGPEKAISAAEQLP